MLREINGLKNRTQNRHKFLLISSTKYEILLASWPLTVALMCAVGRSHVTKSAGFILFLLDEMSWPSKWETLCTLLFGYLIVSKGDVQRYVHAEQL